MILYILWETHSCNSMKWVQLEPYRRDFGPDDTDIFWNFTANMALVLRQTVVRSPRYIYVSGSWVLLLSILSRNE